MRLSQVPAHWGASSLQAATVSGPGGTAMGQLPARTAGSGPDQIERLESYPEAPRVVAGHVLSSTWAQLVRFITHQWSGEVTCPGFGKYSQEESNPDGSAPVVLPDHAYRACVASQLVHLKLAELRKKWRSEGNKWPEIVWNMQSRIGLNSGRATIGNMGSSTRFNYTMMGDNVNLAARMESGAKQYGVYTMVTESTMNDMSSVTTSTTVWPAAVQPCSPTVGVKTCTFVVPGPRSVASRQCDEKAPYTSMSERSAMSSIATWR